MSTIPEVTRGVGKRWASQKKLYTRRNFQGAPFLLQEMSSSIHLEALPTTYLGEDLVEVLVRHGHLAALTTVRPYAELPGESAVHAIDVDRVH